MRHHALACPGAACVACFGALQVSQPYVDMTVKIMERFGVTVERLNGLQHMRVGRGAGAQRE